MKVYALFREVLDIYQHEIYRQNLFNKKLVSIHATKKAAEDAAIENGLMLIGDENTLGVPANIEELDIKELTIIRLIPALVLEKDDEYVFDFSSIPPLQGTQMVVKKKAGLSLYDAALSIHNNVKDLYYKNWESFSIDVYIDRILYMLSSIPVMNGDVKGVNLVAFPVIGNASG